MPIKYLPFEMLSYLIEYWILILLTQYLCSAHLNLRPRNRIICSGIPLLGTFIAFLFYNPYVFIISTSLEILLTIILFSQKRFSDLLRFFAAFAIYFVLSVTPEIILSVLLPASLTPIFPDHTLTWFGLLTDIILLAALLVLEYVLKKYQTTVYFHISEIIGSILLSFFAFIDVGLIMFLEHAHLAPLAHYFFLAVFLGSLIGCFVYYIYSLISSHLRIYRETLARTETEYLRLQLDSLQEIKEQENQVRRMQHDLSSHMAMLRTLCEEGNYEEVRKYTEQLSQDTLSTNTGILTGNKVADLIIRSKMKVCAEHGIEFTFTGSLHNLSAMTAPDICGLLSNAYDNAIEACLPQTGAYIRTKISTTRNYTVVQIVNSVMKKVPIRNNRVSTTKGNKKSHGYGIDIMKRIARKYNGSCTLHCDGQEFTVKFVLSATAYSPSHPDPGQTGSPAPDQSGPRNTAG